MIVRAKSKGDQASFELRSFLCFCGSLCALCVASDLFLIADLSKTVHEAAELRSIRHNRTGSFNRGVFMARNSRVHARSLILALFIAPLALAARAPSQTGDWTITWGSAQQIVEPKNVLPPEALHNVTIRQVVRVTIGGSSLRLRVSNVFGTEPLHINTLHLARPVDAASGRIEANTDRSVTFGAREDVL